MGPGTIARDRFDYVASMSDSWKRQTLINLVKVRYADAPVFLDVASVINSYSWEADLTAGAQLAPTGRGDTFLNVSSAGRYADRPTITYSPLSGEKFARSLMSPLPVTAILNLVQTGYPADGVLRLCVNSINGLDNEYGGPANPRSGTAQFHEVMVALRKAQGSGGFELRRKPSKENEAATMILRPTGEEAVLDSHRRIRELLRLDPREHEFEIVHGSLPSSARQIALETRSMMQVLIDLASYIDVPDADVSEGRVYALSRTAEQLRMYPPLLRIHSGAASPSQTHVAVRYRDHWFWIDDRDVHSKLAFNFLLLAFFLTETGSEQAAPIVTIPVR